MLQTARCGRMLAEMRYGLRCLQKFTNIELHSFKVFHGRGNERCLDNRSDFPRPEFFFIQSGGTPILTSSSHMICKSDWFAFASLLYTA